MKKTSVALSKDQVDFFKENSALGQSKFIREAIDEKISKYKHKKEVVET